MAVRYLNERGYYGYSMSNNAVAAYEQGEKPLSKWNKSDLIQGVQETIRDYDITPKFSMDKLKKQSVSTIRDCVLEKSSWHHTSSYYNRTDFYEISSQKLEELTDEEIDNYAGYNANEKQQKKEEQEEMWEVSYLEWSGTRNHPKATRVNDTGVIKGNWFYKKNGSKKNINSNGFKKIKQLKENKEMVRYLKEERNDFERIGKDLRDDLRRAYADAELFKLSYLNSNDSKDYPSYNKDFVDRVNKIKSLIERAQRLL